MPFGIHPIYGQVVKMAGKTAVDHLKAHREIIPPD
jgi:hypothetical protein